MAINIHCPHCNERLVEQKTNCTHCNEVLPPGVLFALSAALGEPVAEMPMPVMPKMPDHIQLSTTTAEADPAAHPALSTPTQNSSLRPWLAAALSIVCGLGQLYNGQVVKGMILIVLATAAIASIGLLIGKFMVPVLWLYAIIDAYVVARRHPA